jgi:hypothetical protein
MTIVASTANVALMQHSEGCCTPLLASLLLHPSLLHVPHNMHTAPADGPSLVHPPTLHANITSQPHVGLHSTSSACLRPGHGVHSLSVQVYVRPP